MLPSIMITELYESFSALKIINSLVADVDQWAEHWSSEEEISQ